ncbi:hypothetical protein HRbin06_00951 [archaeon HR06]|nr:hypothetical protein HRbin06_00951 [archaeon HR06]
MKVGVISDTHDNIINIKKVLKKLEGIDILIHCGDFCAPFVIDILKDFKVKKIYAVLGNVDGDKFRIRDKKPENMIIFPELGEFEIEGKKVALVHFPEFALALALTNKYDAVFYGHTHEAKKERYNKTLLLNPGEILGMKGKVTYALYYPEINDAEILELD